MSSGDILIWLAVGLIAGGLAAEACPPATPARRVAVWVAGMSGAILGALAAGTLADTGAVRFLGAAALGVCMALAACLVSWRRLGKNTG